MPIQAVSWGGMVPGGFGLLVGRSGVRRGRMAANVVASSVGCLGPTVCLCADRCVGCRERRLV